MIFIERADCPSPLKLETTHKYPLNKSALEESSFGKCMYCERKIIASGFGDVEHIKPKSLFSSSKDANKWSNLGFSCSRCNTYKSNKYDPLSLIINPYNEQPEDFLTADGANILPIEPSFGRAYTTIDTVKLNRSGLIESRQDKLKGVALMIRLYNIEVDIEKKAMLLKFIEESMQNKEEYSLVVKKLVEQYLER